jgi:hypothetical protein
MIAQTSDDTFPGSGIRHLHEDVARQQAVSDLGELAGMVIAGRSSLPVRLPDRREVSQQLLGGSFVVNNGDWIRNKDATTKI